MWTMLLAANLAADVDVSIFDSRDDTSKVWMLVGDCPVLLDKKRLTDFEYVTKMVKQICHVELGKENE